MFSLKPRQSAPHDPPSEVLPALPDGWRYERLRNAVDVRTSPVDKVVVAGETSVRLCNYTDVYKRPYIGEGEGYMRASATPSEFKRFRLEDDDVIITKDSETWQDMATATYVVDPPKDMVCGYHLALLRPNRSVVRGRYLVHALRVPRIHWQFQVGSNGVTRFGLSQGPLKSALVPIPPADEQAAIVKYLGHAHARIDGAIAAKRKLIALLEEQKQAIIHETVTRGLDPTVPLKDSGIPWLGEVPAHWACNRAGLVFREVVEKSALGLETPLSMSQRLGLVPSDQVERSLGAASMAGRKRCKPGDLVLNRLKAHLGVFAQAKQAGVVSPDYTVLRPRSDISVSYFEHVLRSPAMRGELRIRAKGIVEGFWRLYTDDFYALPLPNPPITEQYEIVHAISEKCGEIDGVTLRAVREIDLLREFRVRLTSDVVTGQVDVRGIAGTLPELEPPVVVADKIGTGESLDELDDEL